MGLGPINRWDTGLPFYFQFTRNSQPVPIDSYPTTAIRLHFWQKSSGLHKLGVGQVLYDDAPNGRFHYVLNRRDSDTPGLWEVWSEIFTASAGSISSTNADKLQINDRPNDYAKRATGRMYVTYATPPQVQRVP